MAHRTVRGANWIIGVQLALSRLFSLRRSIEQREQMPSDRNRKSNSGQISFIKSTRTIETALSLFKRGLVGSHHQMSLGQKSTSSTCTRVLLA